VSKKDFSITTTRLRRTADERNAASQHTVRERLRSVQAQIEAIERGDFEGALAQAAHDVTLDIFAPPEFPWVRHARGIDELRHALQHNFASIQEQRPEVTNVHAEAEAVVLFGHETGRIAASGETYEMEFVERFTFRDDRLVSIRIIAAHVQHP
jgi:ketosteroid isomerase-like protein